MERIHHCLSIVCTVFIGHESAFFSKVMDFSMWRGTDMSYIECVLLYGAFFYFFNLFSHKAYPELKSPSAYWKLQ